MSLTQSMRLAISSGLIWIAGKLFDGTLKPIGYVALFASVIPASIFYILLYRKKQLFSNPTLKKEI